MSEFVSPRVISREQFIRELFVYVLCLSPLGKSLYEWYKRRQAKKYENIAVPLIRRIFPELTAHQLVSVQQMTQPSAHIFYMDFSYGTNRHRSKIVRTDILKICQ